MKKTSIALAVLLGTFTFAGTASASAIPTILLDQASNLDPAAYAPVGSNSLGVSYTASDWPLIAGAGGQNATVGNDSSNWGTAGIFGFYAADSTAISALQADSASIGGGPVIYGFNLYAPASLGGQQVGFLVEEFLTAQNSAILTLTEMATTSLSGYVPTLAYLANTNFFSTGNITVTGFVQDTGTLYGLDTQIRANAPVPVPAALFFVAPALAGLFGFARRKRSEA